MQLNHSSPTPLYYQLRQMIRNNIVDGVWQDGMMLPSETQLATELKLSRQTVKQAYDGLVQEGLVSADAHVAKRLRLNVGELLNIDSSAISWHKYNEGGRANGRLFCISYIASAFRKEYNTHIKIDISMP